MSILSLHSGSMVMGERLINCIVEGTLIALLVSILFRLKTFRDSATRFAIWLVTLLAILILPFLGSARSSQIMKISAPHMSVPAGWLGYALAMWVVISVIGIFRICVGVTRLRGLRLRACELSSAELPIETRWIAQEFFSRPGVRICVSDEVNSPTAIGFMRPAVLIPAWALSELTGENLRSVLLHELGHLRRWDDWTNLLQKLLRAIFFFHPAVWWIDSRLCLEREMACDDLVIAETHDAHGYAECLVSLAEKSVLRRGVALAVAAVGRVRQMTLRFGRILDQSSRRPVSRVALASLSVAGMFAIAASTHLPMLVILQNVSPSSAVLSKKAEDANTPRAAKLELASAATDQSRVKVIPAVMETSSALQKSESKNKPRVVRAAQHEREPKLRVVHTSLKTGNKEMNSQPALLLILGTVQLQSDVPELVLTGPFLTTIACGSNASGACTVTSTGVIRLTVYSGSGAIRNEFVAKVI